RQPLSPALSLSKFVTLHEFEADYLTTRKAEGRRRRPESKGEDFFFLRFHSPFPLFLYFSRTLTAATTRLDPPMLLCRIFLP
ncbi:hypothetical protein Dimus_036606, partial [Dionaea muscipula]